MKTEKQGKVKLQYRQKGLVNPPPEYLVKVCDGTIRITRYFTTQTEAFAFAMPKGFEVFRILKDNKLEKIELRPQVSTRIENTKKTKEKTESRFCNSWMNRKSPKTSKKVKKKKGTNLLGTHRPKCNESEKLRW